MLKWTCGGGMSTGAITQQNNPIQTPQQTSLLQQVSGKVTEATDRVKGFATGAFEGIKSAASNLPSTGLLDRVASFNAKQEIGQIFQKALALIPHSPSIRTNPQSNAIPASISGEKGADTYNKQGAKVEGGGEGGQYVNFIGGSDSRFNVKIEGEPTPVPSKEGYQSKFDSKEGTATLLITDPQKGLCEVKVNLQEMSDRLLIPKDQLVKAAKNGKLDELLQAKEPKLKNLSKVMDGYETFLKNNDYSSSETKLMMKVIRNYYKAGPGEGDVVEMKIGSLFNRVKVLAVKDGDRIVAAKVLGRLGSGSFGTVSKIQRLDIHNKIQAMKVAKDSSDMGAYAIDSIKKEAAMLKEIHKDGKIRGIQSPVDVKFNKGFFGKMYKMDGLRLKGSADFIKSSMSVKLDVCEQILFAGAHLEHKGIVHFDQKLQNLFMKKGKGGNLKVYIADFGDAKHFDPNNPTPSAYTPPYMPRNEKNQPTPKTDVFQRGMMMYELLTGILPYDLNSEDGHPEGAFDAEALDRIPGLPPEMKTLIADMCNMDPDKRPNSKEAYEKLAQFMKANSGMAMAGKDYSLNLRPPSG